MSVPDADRELGAPPGRAARLARLAVSAPIVVYQRVISPGLPRRCRYEPTCSRYAVQAIERYGILRGLVLAAWRLLRCNPWSPGGYDPVGSQRVFKAESVARARH
jgi:uncharacterized protein